MMAGKNGRKVWKIINETLARNKIEGKVGQSFLDEEENIEKCAKAFNDCLVYIGERIVSEIQESDENIDYFPTRTEFHRFTFREVQEEDVIRTISDLEGNSGPGWDGIRIDTFKLAKTIFASL